MFSFPLKLFLKDRWIWAGIAAAVFLNLFSWFYLGFGVKTTAESVFLHYTINFGVDLAGPWSEIFFLPILGLFLALLNFFLAYFLYAGSRNLSRLILASAVLLEFFLLLESFSLVFLNH